MGITFVHLGVPGFPVGCPGYHNHPAITTSLNREMIFSDEELCLLQLPCRLGGIGLPSFQSMAAGRFAGQFKVSCDITAGQVEEILHQQDES